MKKMSKKQKSCKEKEEFKNKECILFMDRTQYYKDIYLFIDSKQLILEKLMS